MLIKKKKSHTSTPDVISVFGTKWDFTVCWADWAQQIYILAQYFSIYSGAGAHMCQRSLSSMYLMKRGKNFKWIPIITCSEKHSTLLKPAQQSQLEMLNVMPGSFDEKETSLADALKVCRPSPPPTPPQAWAIARQQAPCSAERQEASWQQR